MRKLAEYGIGCGTILLFAGLIFAAALYFGWTGGSSRAIFQIVLLLGQILGSQYLAAGVISVVGVIFILIGLGIRETQNERR